MIEDELITIWQSSLKVEQIKFEKSRLMLDVQSSLDRFHKLLKYGVLMEQMAVILVIPVFIFYVYFVPFAVSKSASIFIAIWGIYYMLKLRALKKLKPSSTSGTFLNYLLQNRDYLNHLKKMLDTAIYWYILPCIFGVLLFLLGYILGGVLNDISQISIILCVVFITGIATHFYIKWIIRSQYMPRLKKIEELLKVLEE